jgi:hypothetical protein
MLTAPASAFDKYTELEGVHSAFSSPTEEQWSIRLVCTLFSRFDSTETIQIFVMSLDSASETSLWKWYVISAIKYSQI